MAYVITLANAKSGCGKTTVALNLAICFARAGYRTLAIDLDQQGNLSAGLGVDLNKLSLTTHRLIISEAPEIRRYLVEIRPQLHLLPNSIDIEADDLLEAKKVNRELLLRRQLKPVLPDFDVVLIDTPPATTCHRGRVCHGERGVAGAEYDQLQPVSDARSVREGCLLPAVSALPRI